MKMRLAFYLLLVVLSVVCVTSCSPTDPVAEYNAALQLIEQKNYPAALEHAKTCVRMNREDIDAIKLQTLCAFSYEAEEVEEQTLMLKEQEAALQNLKRIVKSKAKDDYEAHYFLGWAHYQMYNYREARISFLAAYKLMPKESMLNTATYHNLLYMIGICCVQDNLPEGLQYLGMLQDIEPYNQWPEYYMNYASLAYRLRQYDVSIEWLKKARQLAPNMPQPDLNIAVIYDVDKRSKMEARRWYLSALAKYQAQRNNYFSKKIQRRLTTLVKR